MQRDLIDRAVAHAAGGMTAIAASLSAMADNHNELEDINVRIARQLELGLLG